MSFIIRTGLFLTTYLTFLLIVTILISDPFTSRVALTSVVQPEGHRSLSASNEFLHQLRSPRAEIWLHKESLKLEMDEEYDERVEAHRRGLLKWESSSTSYGGFDNDPFPEIKVGPMQGHV